MSDCNSVRDSWKQMYSRVGSFKADIKLSDCGPQKGKDFLLSHRCYQFAQKGLAGFPSFFRTGKMKSFFEKRKKKTFPF